MSTRSSYTEVQAQSRSALAQRINDAINQIGPDRIITVVMDEGGKFAERGGRFRQTFATLKAYIYYKAD